MRPRSRSKSSILADDFGSMPAAIASKAATAAFGTAHWVTRWDKDNLNRSESASHETGQRFRLRPETPKRVEIDIAQFLAVYNFG
jgi:hypothetical protein